MERWHHVAVTGGGIAGLTAAIALAGHARRVTVVERDALAGDPGFRPGVPQSRHLHSLMGAGQRALDELLPGFTDELYAAGAVPLRTPYDHVWLSPAGWCHRFAPSRTVPSASRELVEWVVRRRAESLPGIRIRDRLEVTGLRADGAGITGVAVVRRDGGATEEIAADLVVDTSGRRSRAPEWLASLGCDDAETTLVDSRAGYASRYYAMPADFGDAWRVISIQPGPSQPLRGGALVPVEGGRWLVSLYGYLDDHPPTDEEGFLAFAASLRHPVLYETIRDAEPLGPIHGFRHMANERRHYEALAAWPQGLLVVGDATCALNPVYAQGMSVAAMSAHRLRDLLHEGVDDCATLQKELAAGNDRAWHVAVGADLAYLGEAPADEESRRGGERMRRLLELAMVDAEVNSAFFDVMMMLAEPDALDAPELTARLAQGPARPPAARP
ncbi:FAD-dependent monooxygenase [Actinomadura madurae]|uniref:NAD(P)/FAD-dependent oxidoreductase n=1 Tax=Actinomadura madurae TaxID=1993 RepID=UPI0020275B71|nr:FAD-dependent monooxygenase [Actinomadura madurae]URN01089.1 FAD-dependent monooxygenase [Actinomadura madurae]